MMGASTSKRKSVRRESADPNILNHLSAMESEADQHFEVLARLKERRRAELAAMEEQRLIALAEEARLSNAVQAQRNQFLDSVSQSQKELESQIKQVHQQQEVSRQKFCQELCRAEAELEKSVKDVLKNASIHRDPARLQELIEAEEKQVQSLLALKMEEYRNLRRAEVLSAMEEQMEKEVELFRQKPSETQGRVDLLCLRDSMQDRDIEKVLKSRQKGQTELVSRLVNEENWQRCAFIFLLSEKDKRTAQLRRDINLVIDQLNQLSNLEMQRRAQKISMTTVTLSETRLQLAELLSSLLRQRDQRREDLNKLLREMEEQRQNQAADYWLIQYQRLMESIPSQLGLAGALSPTRTADPTAVASLTTSCLPVEPSAPPMESSAPPVEPNVPLKNEVFLETTCVVCMDAQSQVVFLTCGHLCCCVGCGDSVQLCPMCRSGVVQRLRVHF